MFLIGTLLRMICRQVQIRLAPMDRDETFKKSLLQLPGRIDILMRLLIVVTYGMLLTLGGWARLIYQEWSLQRLILIDELVLLGPFIVLMVVKWYCQYPISRIVREYIMTGQLKEGLPTRPVWSRRQYLSFQIRQGLLIILIPLLFMLAFRDMVEMVFRYAFSERNGFISEPAATISQTITGLGAFMIFLLAPLMLKRIWITRSLPGGPLRQKLVEFCQKIKLKCRDILLWDTYSAVANAAVMGLLRPVRYVLISDNLIENMSDEQIEAVFAHEAGHVKHHHILFMVLFVFGGCSGVMLLMQLFHYLLYENWNGTQIYAEFGDGMTYGAGGLFFLGWILMFGWISRRFERQADVHGALSVDAYGSSRLSMAGDSHDSNGNQSALLGHHGAYVMSTALHRIALLNGIAVESRSWRHSSIASRIFFLRHLASREGSLRNYYFNIMLIKIMIVAIVLLSGAGWYLAMKMTENI